MKAGASSMYYVAHRLFALHDRWLGARAAQTLADRVGADAVFLPFCDTDEERLTAPAKGRHLYELDLARLDMLKGMLALLHGPSLDDGVGFEIGYTARRGTPVLGFSSDFQTYGLDDGSSTFSFADPLVDVVLTRLHRAPVMAPPAQTSRPSGSRFEEFADRNLRALDEGLRQAVIDLVALVAEPSTRTSPDPRPGGQALLDLAEFWHSDQTEPLTGVLHNHGFHVHRCERWNPTNRLDTDRAIAAASRDWQALQASDVLITDLTGPETPIGAAILLGAARAQGAVSIGLYPSQVRTFAPGREPNLRNLMIQYGLTGIAASPDDVNRLLRQRKQRA